MESLQEEKCQQKEVSAIMQTCSSHERVDLKEAKCFLCDEPAGSAGLHNASTYDIDMKVRKCAMELEDTTLLAKLAPGDMIASTLCCIVHMQSTNLKLVLPLDQWCEAQAQQCPV